VQHDDVHLGVLDHVLEALEEGLDGRKVQGVVSLGTVEREIDHLAVTLNEDRIGHG
jgi:hypothetical protein